VLPALAELPELPHAVAVSAAAAIRAAARYLFSIGNLPSAEKVFYQGLRIRHLLSSRRVMSRAMYPFFAEPGPQFWLML
jgi:hypothetical protein